jgi:hypothetical protein
VISYVAVSLIMCTGGAYRPFRHDRHFSAASSFQTGVSRGRRMASSGRLAVGQARRSPPSSRPRISLGAVGFMGGFVAASRASLARIFATHNWPPQMTSRDLVPMAGTTALASAGNVTRNRCRERPGGPTGRSRSAPSRWPKKRPQSEAVEAEGDVSKKGGRDTQDNPPVREP